MGLGEHLMARGLTRLEKLGAGVVTLEVVATNVNVLSLYRDFEFAVRRQFDVYSRPLKSRPLKNVRPPWRQRRDSETI